MSGPNGKKQIIANRLREARKLAGLSQGQVAKLLNMHRPTISEIEAGNRSLSAEELAQLAEIYDVSIRWLSGQGAEKLDPHDDRLQLAYRELSKLKPDGIDTLMRVLAVMRKRSDEAIGSRFPVATAGTFLQDSEMHGVTVATDAAHVEWTEEANARRCDLIDKKVQDQISVDEAGELENLQQAMRRHINQVSPLPFDAARQLHAELLEKQRSER